MIFIAFFRLLLRRVSADRGLPRRRQCLAALPAKWSRRPGRRVLRPPPATAHMSLAPARTCESGRIREGACLSSERSFLVLGKKEGCSRSCSQPAPAYPLSQNRIASTYAYKTLSQTISLLFLLRGGQSSPARKPRRRRKPRQRRAPCRPPGSLPERSSRGLWCR